MPKSSAFDGDYGDNVIDDDGNDSDQDHDHNSIASGQGGIPGPSFHAYRQLVMMTLMTMPMMMMTPMTIPMMMMVIITKVILTMLISRGISVLW